MRDKQAKYYQPGNAQDRAVSPHFVFWHSVVVIIRHDYRSRTVGIAANKKMKHQLHFICIVYRIRYII